MSHPPTARTRDTQAPDRSLIGGRYRIETVLAEGGMGAVYQVFDERTGESVALKRLRSDNSRQMLALFEREYRTLAGIQHPRIIRAFDYGLDAGGPYYTMELALGRDLRQLAPLPVPDACRYLRDVATCLALLHTRRLLHRDITPRNVRVLDSGACKLIDFGALTSFGLPEDVVGTPPCIPPEALKRVALDQRADIYSLGALLYWTLTRKHAYPAKRIDELPQAWRTRPEPPSSHAPSVPKQLDALVLSMLSQDPAMRPATMVDVAERLTAIGHLPPEDEDTRRALADSYLTHSGFIGRDHEVSALRQNLAQLDTGRGSATLVLGPAGVGRNRLLREATTQAQMTGLRSVHVDAGMHPQANGTAIAIVHGLLDISPSARREAAAHASSLAQLDHELAGRLGVPAAAPHAAVSGDWRARMQEILFGVFSAACEEGRLLLAVDDVDQADDASLALLAGLLRVTDHAPLALMLSAHEDVGTRQSRSWQMLRERCRTFTLSPWSAEDTLVLTRSLFGDARNVARFAEWLHDSTGGMPLYTMELIRRLHARGELRYLDGIWVLPAERPAHVATEGLSDLLLARLSELSPPALALCEALAIQRGTLSRERCLEHAALESSKPYGLLDELVRTDVLEDSLQGYRFAHGVLREALLSRMTEERRRQLHLRCAESALARARTDDAMAGRIEAGWHFLQAGEDSRGADELAGVAFDTVGVRFAFADLQVAAPALEAALAVYTKQGRHLYDRLPLMACLAQAGYYEDRVWAERYGEEALAAMEQVSGLALARKLSRWLGKTLGLVTALSIAALKFRFTPKRVRTYRFVDVMIQLFGVVTTLTGAATIALDYKNAQRIAATLKPFTHLPARLTPVGIAQFCDSLKEICRDNQAQALATWSVLIRHFNDRTYYPTLPDQARPLYIGGLWFARGVFEAFRDEGGALVAADALDALGIKLYRMIGSALRSLHYANRGQFDQAQQHREQVDVHAIQIGSAWQVEMWEPAALILAYTSAADPVELLSVQDRLTTLSAKYPSLAFYAKLAELAHALAREERSGSFDASHEVARDALALLHSVPARSFIGWGAVWGYVARYYNLCGDYAMAEQCSSNVLSHMRPEDRPFVALYLGVELEHAVATAGLGRHDAARAALDDLLTLHGRSDNPLTRGRLHEAYARVAALMGDWPSFRHHLEETRSFFRRTGASTLIGQAERLRTLDPVRSEPPPRAGLKLPTT